MQIYKCFMFLRINSVWQGLIFMLSEMWYQVFLWCLFSSIFVHLIAAAIAFGRLRKHKIGRFIPLAFIAMGLISPLTGGVVTSKCYNFNFFLLSGDAMVQFFFSIKILEVHIRYLWNMFQRIYSMISQHLFRECLAACSVPSHHLSHRWIVGSWA